MLTGSLGEGSVVADACHMAMRTGAPIPPHWSKKLSLPVTPALCGMETMGERITEPCQQSSQASQENGWLQVQ